MIVMPSTQTEASQRSVCFGAAISGVRLLGTHMGSSRGAWGSLREFEVA